MCRIWLSSRTGKWSYMLQGEHPRLPGVQQDLAGAGGFDSFAEAASDAAEHQPRVEMEGAIAE